MVARCLLFISCHGTSMSQWWHFGWGRFPSSKTTTLFRTCRWRKCTRIAVLVTARPRQPSTGQFRGLPAVRKAIWYVRASSLRGAANQLNLPSAALPCCVLICPASDLSAISNRTPCTGTFPSIALSIKGPLPSSVSHTPPPNESLLPGIGC